MSDESSYTTSTEGTTPTGGGTAERVGFCQDCGTPLTRETMRAVGTGVFCEAVLDGAGGFGRAGVRSGWPRIRRCLRWQGFLLVECHRWLELRGRCWRPC